MDRPDLLLNLMEMWCCLLFRTLPQPLLAEYLPPGSMVPVGPPDGLNMSSPLDQGLPLTEREWVDMSETQDPLLQGYYGFGRNELVESRPRPRPSKKRDTNVDQLHSRIIFAGVLAFAGFLIWRTMGPSRALRTRGKLPPFPHRS